MIRSILLFLFSVSLKFNIFVEALTCPYGTVSNGLSCDPCSSTSFSENVKIVGGTVAVEGSWPGAAYLEIAATGTYIANGVTKTAMDGPFRCGGTLIDRYTVLTAAHCKCSSTFIVTDDDDGKIYNATVANPLDPRFYAVYLGAFNISFPSFEPWGHAVLASVKAVIPYPTYDQNGNAYNNDLMIIQFSSPVTLNSHIQPACLPDPSYGTSYPSTTNKNITAYAMGWGTLSSGGSLPELLMNVRLSLYDMSIYCNEYPVTNQEKQLCAGQYLGGKDTCQGDSGGGIYIYDSNISKYIPVGIVSFGLGCGSPETPGIYTRISYYYSWIKSYMNNAHLATTTTKISPGLSGSNINYSSLISVFNCFYILFYLNF